MKSRIVGAIIEAKNFKKEKANLFHILALLRRTVVKGNHIFDTYATNADSVTIGHFGCSHLCNNVCEPDFHFPDGIERFSRGD